LYYNILFQGTNILFIYWLLPSPSIDRSLLIYNTNFTLKNIYRILVTDHFKAIRRRTD